MVDTVRAADGEGRQKAIGQIQGKLFFVVYVMRGGVCRIISARRTNTSEERAHGTLDPENPPVLTDAALADLDALTSDEIEHNARDDPDNPPMTADELPRLRPLHPPQPARARRRSGGAS